MKTKIYYLLLALMALLMSCGNVSRTKTAKEQYVKEFADKYFKEGKISNKVYNALLKYEV